MVRERSFGTHDGSFHADEVSACALLLLFKRIDRDKIVRTRDPRLLDECAYVCDVGGIYDPKIRRFDHHQLSYGGELSSAGMIWLYLYQEGEISKECYDFFNRSLIWGIDAHDTGRSHPEVGSSTFSHIIANFVPPMYDASEHVQTEAFFEALDFAYGHFERLLKRFEYIVECKKVVEQSMQTREHFLLFDHAIPWLESFFDLGGESHPALFVIMPSGGHWKLRAIPPSLNERMQMRKPLPAEWAGLRDEELQKASGIKGAIFCHKGRFISIWKTKQDALKALQKVLEA